MTSRYALTAAQWPKLEGILPGKAGDRGRTVAGHRTFVNGVMWVLRSGAHGKHLPDRYGNWKSIPRRFTCWAKAGIWERIYAVLM
jgi:transposase